MLDYLRIRQYIFRKIREFFTQRDYIEVETPYIVRTVPPDPHIEPVFVYVERCGPYFLHTSPEIYMKKLLATGLKRIFQICRVFRAEREDEIHRVEFTMLEWYREGNYMDTLKETEELLDFISSLLEREFGIKKSFSPPFAIFDLEELFTMKLDINPFHFDRDGLYDLLRKRKIVRVNEGDSWIDMFLKVFLEKIDPYIDKSTPYFIVGWPYILTSMAKAKNGKAERFELYVDGVEIANGYSELLNPDEQRKRFEKDNIERIKTGKREMMIDEEFISCLSEIVGDYSGVALGLDRLVTVLTGEKDIGKVWPFKL